MSKVVTATAAMTASGGLTGGEAKTILAVAIEQAMIKAVQDCAAKGITDDDSVRAAMLAARDKLLGG